MICKKCKKVFEVFFCPECTELSIQKLAEMMEKELEKQEQNLTSSSSKAAGACACHRIDNSRIETEACPIHGANLPPA